MPEIEALEKAEGERWNRDGRLAAWFLAWIPAFVSYGVLNGIAAAFDGKDLPEIPTARDLLDTIPDYMKDSDRG